MNKPELVPIASLKPHPRNYRRHPDDQIQHIVESLRAHGLYRNIVVARDNVILAGHGLVQAAEREGMTEILAIKLDIDPESPRALKILTGDNEIAKLAEVDDRMLTDMLREIQTHDVDGLIGTGFDDSMLSALFMVTRPAHEIQKIDEESHWKGMPDYFNVEKIPPIIVHFKTEDDKKAFLELVGAVEEKHAGVNRAGTIWYPPRTMQDQVSKRFET